MKIPKFLPKRVSGKLALMVVPLVDRCISTSIDANSGRLSWELLTALVLAGAITTTQVVNQKDQVQAAKAKTWLRSIRDKIDKLRVDLGRITSELARRETGNQPTDRQVRNLRLLKRAHHVESSGELRSLAQKLKDRLQLHRARLALREEERSRVKLRRNFSTKCIARYMTPDAEPSNTVGDPLDLKAVRQFWKRIVGIRKAFKSDDGDLQDWASQLRERQVELEALQGVSWEDFEAVLRKAKPWKAPGPDGIHAFWWKSFKSAAKALYGLTSSHLSSGEVLPKWLVTGRVVLIHKSGSQEDPANFRPIACLNTSYKMVTALLASHIGSLTERLSVLPMEQVAIRKGTWGCTHALLLDQAVVADATNQKQKPLHVAWIDYAKAFDSVPHAYLKWLLQCMGVSGPVLSFISGLMDNWSVRYESRNKLGKVSKSALLSIKSGVLQGDSFSPLLFCLAMAPVSHAISRMKVGYTSSAGGRLDSAKFYLSHLFYMDDLKVYCSSAEDLESVLAKVAEVSASISMSVNTSKCAKASHVPKRLGVEGSATGETSLDIRGLTVGSTYKYLGIEQRLGIKPSLAWERAEEKVVSMYKCIWSIDLTFRQKVNASNAILPAVTYVVRNSFKGAGKYTSVLKRAEDLDKRVRSMLVSLGARYRSSSVDRLYLNPSQGGYGLASVYDSVMDATIYAWAYVCTRRDLAKQYALFQALSKRGKRCVLTDATHVLEETGCIVSVDASRSLVRFGELDYADARDLARAVTCAMRTTRNTIRLGAWTSLTLAGKVLRSQIEPYDSFIWLRSGKVSAGVVRNVLAAQEGCLLTRASPGSHAEDSTCRKCGATWETPEHVLSNCTRWLSTLYIERHDAVVRCIHYRCCIMAGLLPPHHTQRVPGVLSNSGFNLYCNHPIQTSAVIRHNKPDIVLYDLANKTAKIIEVAVAWHSRLAKQERTKVNRYTVNGNYEDELQETYPSGDNLFRELVLQGWTTEFIPIIIGTCGEVGLGVKASLKRVFGSEDYAHDCIERMCRSAALGSNRIIKQHLA